MATTVVGESDIVSYILPRAIMPTSSAICDWALIRGCPVAYGDLICSAELKSFELARRSAEQEMITLFSRVYQALVWDNTLRKSVKSQGFREAGQKQRGARQLHKRLLYCVNVNRTSLDHLLLG